MASNMDLILGEVPPGSLRASANALSGAIAVAGDDLIVAKAGWFSKKVNRYPLASLTGVRFSPNPHSDLLALEFRDAGGLTLMFGPEAKADAERLAEVLTSVVGSR